MARKVRIPPNVQLWPALSRFYGLSFTELRKMPRWAVRLYAEEMAVLHAAEQLDRMEAASTPYLEDADEVARQYRSILRRADYERRNPEDAAPTAPERKPLPDRAALAGLGIAVVKEG